jgi:hypothetical protein
MKLGSDHAMDVIRNTGLGIIGRITTIRPAIATNDELIASWLKKYLRQNTKDAYAAEVRAFRSFVGRPLQAVKKGDIEAYADNITGLAASTQSRRGSCLCRPHCGRASCRYAAMPGRRIQCSVPARAVASHGCRCLALLMRYSKRSPSGRACQPRHLPSG